MNRRYPCSRCNMDEGSPVCLQDERCEGRARVPSADFECERTPSEKDNKLHELAKRYHAETEAYDRTVCTGPIIHGSIMPYGGEQTVLINRHARQVFQRIEAEAAQHGISRAEMWRAIGKQT